VQTFRFLSIISHRDTILSMMCDNTFKVLPTREVTHALVYKVFIRVSDIGMSCMHACLTSSPQIPMDMYTQEHTLYSKIRICHETCY
jgi:hypothetical protein